jgi:calcineurin-like phosphoesterase family protein
MDYFISDLHLNHRNIIKYCNRPFNNVEEMNKTLILNWNNTVKKEDRVFFLGDFCLGGKEAINEFSRQLNGKIIMIKGNHERSDNEIYTNSNFAVVSPFPILYNERIILSHKPIENLLDGMINIHGHIHDLNYEDSAHHNVSVEHTNYKPITLEEALKN